MRQQQEKLKQVFSSAKKIVEHDFIVANITVEAITGVEYMIRYGLKLDFKKKTLRYSNVELPLDIGYRQHVKVAKVTISEQ